MCWYRKTPNKILLILLLRAFVMWAKPFWVSCCVIFSQECLSCFLKGWLSTPNVSASAAGQRICSGLAETIFVFQKAPTINLHSETNPLAFSKFQSPNEPLSFSKLWGMYLATSHVTQNGHLWTKLLPSDIRNPPRPQLSMKCVLLARNSHRISWPWFISASTCVQIS